MHWHGVNRKETFLTLKRGPFLFLSSFPLIFFAYIEFLFSAKDATNVEQAFQHIAKLALQQEPEDTS